MEALVHNRGWQETVGYEKAIELKMQRLFATISGKDRRRYAGIDAAKLGHGGIGYISKLFDIDPKTVKKSAISPVKAISTPTPATTPASFVATASRHWWERHGSKQYPGRRRLLSLCDDGGSNASNGKEVRCGFSRKYEDCF